MKTFRIGGVHPAENKLSAGKAIETLALPKQAVFPLSQHIGAPATAIVNRLFLLMWKVTNGKKASTAAANW